MPEERVWSREDETLFLAIRGKLRAFFASRRVDAVIADELISEVFDRVLRNKSRGVPIVDLERFCVGVASNVLREHWRHVGRQQDFETTLTEAFANPSRESTATGRGAVLSALRACVEELTVADRDLAMRCYGDGKSKDIRAVLAAELGLSRNALDARVSRIRKRLEACVGRKLGRNALE